MSFSNLWEFDAAVAGNNTDIDGNNIAESCLPGGINNALRSFAMFARRLCNQGADIASAGTCNIAATGTSFYVKVTGTTGITSFGTANAGVWRWVTFTGALLLTHNATSMILSGAANYTTAAGDMAFAVSEGSGNWRVRIFKADGTFIGTIATAQIANDAVTYAKIQNISSNNIVLGRATAGAGDTEELTAGVGLTVSAGAIRATFGLINRYYDEYATNTDLTVAIPEDDTIPTNAEGTQILSRVATTTSATQRVRIRVRGFGDCASGGGDLIMALYRDGTCKQVSIGGEGAGNFVETRNVMLEYEEVPGAAGNFTYTIRVGASTGNCRMNGDDGARLFGGAAKTTMIIEVFEP